MIAGFLNTYSQQIIAVANILIALGTIALAIGVPLSLKSTRVQQKFNFYAILDETYRELQQLILDQPHLAYAPGAVRTREQKIQYEAYAFIVWNFNEAIFDYMADDVFLRDTWECILEFEAGVHIAWFYEGDHRKRFKSKFVNYVKEKFAEPPKLQPTPHNHSKHANRHAPKH